MDSLIIYIVGKTGAGKTTISTRLSDLLDIPIFRFHEKGILIGNNIKNKMLIQKIEHEIINEIMDAYKKHRCLVVDGLISFDCLLAIEEKGANVFVAYIDTKYIVRIKRISHRCGCTRFEALLINRKKEKGKKYGNYKALKRQSNIVINGTQDEDIILCKIINSIKERYDFRLL